MADPLEVRPGEFKPAEDCKPHELVAAASLLDQRAGELRGDAMMLRYVAELMDLERRSAG
jgi:hypothetical protein